MKHVHIPSLPWQEIHSPARKFHSFYRNISVALGGIRNGGTWCGGHPFDVQIRRIPPGAAVCPFHSHLAQWELFVVQSGSGTVRAGSETHAVHLNDVFLHPPGEPHQLLNSGAGDLEVLIVADNPELDAFYYPDSNKWGLRPPGNYFRINEVDYFDGEEPATSGAAPYQPSGFPASPSLAPFAQRLVHSERLPWEDWSSPRGNFAGSSKELSIALGAKRNTPTGLGGHPFDLELSKLAPGKTGCPFHSHAAQWEMFILLRGRGIARCGNERIEVRAGDAFIHPPGEAHQLINTGDEEMTFYLVADNPPVDYWHYPDSNKWGFRAPRKFFRTIEVDYYDGEE
jgi:uncharacterized cupin superfamily protein